MVSAPNDPSRREEVYRILSIDGAGIYGLVSAIWLRKLCERDENFLSGNDIQLFSGISAGAANTLLLARHKRPRDAVLSGELERFWTEPIGAFSHEMNPVTAWLSLFGIGGWFGTEDFLHQLQRYFGDMTLADLPHKVQISTFNWTGDREIQWGAPPSFGAPAGFGVPGGFGVPSGFGIPSGFGVPTGSGAPAGFSWPGIPPPTDDPDLANRSWEPRFFTNLPGDSDSKQRIVDVAYGACAPAGLRAIRGGIGDAGTFAASPSVETMASLIHALKMRGGDSSRVLEQLSKLQQAPGQEAPRQQPPAQSGSGQPAPWEVGPLPYMDNEQLMAEAYSEDSPSSPIAMLSVGNGSIAPFFHLRNFDLSLTQMGMYPTHPFMGYVFPPNAYVQFDGLVAYAHYISLLLLGRRYFRLDLNLMPVPVIMATMMARFPSWRQFFTQQIQYLTATARSEQAVGHTLDFLKLNWLVPKKA